MGLIKKLSEKSVVLFGNYTLLIFLTLQFFVIPIFPVEWHKNLFAINITLIYLNVVIVIRDYRKSLVSYVMVLILLDIVFTIMDLIILTKILFFLNIFLFVFIVLRFLIIIARSKTVNINIILDSINGYLLLGILSTMMINLTMTYNPDAFAFSEAGVLANGVSRISEFQYFALVTLTTLGYGEITPITPAARSIASLISVSGQLYVAIVIALLVGKFSGQSKKENK